MVDTTTVYADRVTDVVYANGDVVSYKPKVMPRRSNYPFSAEMPELLYPGRKPVGKVKVDMESEIGKNLIWYSNFINKKPLVNKGGPIIDYTGDMVIGESHGAMSTFNNPAVDNLYWSCQNLNPYLSNKVTFFIDCRLNASFTQSMFVFSKSVTSSFSFGVYAHKTSASYIAYVRTNGGNKNTPTNIAKYTIGERVVLVGVYDSSELVMYVNGVRMGSIAVTGDMDANGTEISVNRWGDGGAFLISVYSAGIMNIALDDEQVFDLAHDPYKFLIPA